MDYIYGLVYDCTCKTFGTSKNNNTACELITEGPLADAFIESYDAFTARHEKYHSIRRLSDDNNYKTVEYRVYDTYFFIASDPDGRDIPGVIADTHQQIIEQAAQRILQVASGYRGKMEANKILNTVGIAWIRFEEISPSVAKFKDPMMDPYTFYKNKVDEHNIRAMYVHFAILLSVENISRLKRLRENILQNTNGARMASEKGKLKLSNFNNSEHVELRRESE